MISLGLSSGATQAIFSLAGLLVQSLVNDYGEFFCGRQLYSYAC
ncbi:hypothetical protein HMPREF1987_00260 [Peptostreptococcaceae bacterium oral taxon 113 str. W5053]|nr:hypothetical protein HMPREF1987_00260 [Peptostreptococcaceae bacterium oral taxon 113 str. W5053]